MQTYPGFLVYHRQRPLVYINDDNQQNVEQFKQDYCVSQRIQYIPDEWIVYPLKSIIARSVLSKLTPVAATMNNEGFPSSPYYAKEGYIRTKLNPRTWD